MDENLFQEWSEALTALRAKRSEEFTRGQREKVEFSPGDFFDISSKSLDEILDQWMAFEIRSADGKSVNVDQVRAELDSIFDFEVDAISRDMDAVRSGARWDEGEVDDALGKFDATTQELKKKYVLKTGAMGASGQQQKKRVSDEPLQPQRVMHGGGGSGGGSGMSVIAMFLVGMMLGAGPSAYFWNQAKEQDKAHQEERTKMLAEQRALEDSMTMLHERFDQLATGKIPSIPELDREIEKIRRAVGEKKKAAELEYNTQRERLMKKTPAGDRLDQAIARLEETRNQRLSALEAQEAQDVDPLDKQKNMLQELRVK
jgi:hypothetical protein